ncbi:uncharacterized protein UHO2_03641 [Ustilago hordei]|uniref:uncharacterized protein n=1 Tax=Ustilago hordei TaxID=120017 RepID=UPI001A50FC3E|nr:uncharacterized protein UHO2_03641 [Ustilago hordei]SYW75247.1 uncharacterized protein UHO2_03641 [Ustilago hordei]
MLVEKTRASFYCNTPPGLDVVFKCSDMLPYCCMVDSSGHGYCATFSDKCILGGSTVEENK